ncbi:glycosyltransferase family 4 protein [Thioclava indica]|uniref:Glycosyl transferase family 1 domain-containing protein n=1 Tax=Thioclava indica TaxID=1353528 RepID=A0A074JSP1_9RHOB|nr:glycosyltransferase family 4 protein [Thioclava indica]KEO52387.1 hypothetical protein DT23_18675 [Thioclava indica]
MRVANIIEEGKVGGPQVRMLRVAKAMTDVETLIVMPTSNSDQFQEMCDDFGVSWRAVPMTRITKEWRVAMGYILFSPVEVLRLVRLFRREHIDLVHASGGSWQYKGVIAAFLAGVPSVWHLNDTSMPRLFRRIFRLFSALPAGFIFASERSRDYYGAELATRLQAVIPSAVDCGQFSTAANPAGDEEILEILRQAPVIGTVANVSRVKGLETLIHAAAELRRTHPDVRVLIVGPVHVNQARYHAGLVALADSLGVSEAIVWAGARTDIRPLLARMDVYICSSLAESSPVSVWEAMAMERPVVSTDVGDVPAHLVDGVSGYVVPVYDNLALAAKVATLLDDPKLRADFGKAAREVIFEKFAPAQIAEQTHDLYRRILEARRM